jgi:hypothetical protein
VVQVSIRAAHHGYDAPILAGFIGPDASLLPTNTLSTEGLRRTVDKYTTLKIKNQEATREKMHNSENISVKGS